MHPPFRTLVEHKAFVAELVISHCYEPHCIVSFFAEDVAADVYTVLYGR